MTLFKHKILTLIILTIFSSFAQASDEVYSGVFYSYEANGEDFFSSVGVATTFKDSETNIGFQVNMSIGTAEVLTQDGYLEDFVAWEGGVKVGYFSNLSFYVEGGVDLSELVFHDLRYDNYEHDAGLEDNLDFYVGTGIGFNAGPLQLNVFTRLRAIDSQYWQAESEVFSGVQAMFHF